MEVSQRSIKKIFVLNNASFMFIVCYIYAIVFKQLFYIYIQGYVTKNSQQNYVWFNTLFWSVKYSYHSKQNSKSLKKKETRQTSSYYTVIEMLKRQIVHQSISLYPTIVSLVQLFLGPL